MCSIALWQRILVSMHAFGEVTAHTGCFVILYVCVMRPVHSGNWRRRAGRGNHCQDPSVVNYTVTKSSETTFTTLMCSHAHTHNLQISHLKSAAALITFTWELNFKLVRMAHSLACWKFTSSNPLMCSAILHLHITRLTIILSLSSKNQVMPAAAAAAVKVIWWELEVYVMWIHSSDWFLLYVLMIKPWRI